MRGATPPLLMHSYGVNLGPHVSSTTLDIIIALTSSTLIIHDYHMLVVESKGVVLTEEELVVS